LKKLVAVAEAYPELQANASFLDLQRNLTEVEQHIQFARRFYNGSVRNLNIRVDSFPDSVIARAFGFAAAEFFDDDENLS
jgi:LemA protein